MYPKIPAVPCPACARKKLHIDGFGSDTYLGVTCYGCARSFHMEFVHVPENEGRGHCTIEAELKEPPIIATVDLCLTKDNGDGC